MSLLNPLELEASDGTGFVVDERVQPDNRLFCRVALPMLGRFMRPNRSEYPCKLADISVGGAAILSPMALEMGEKIVVYFDELGRLEGFVVRQFDGGFAMTIRASANKREKLAATLTWLLNRPHYQGLEARRHDRIVLRDKQSELKFADGTSAQCNLLDISMSGASIETDVRPAIGTEVVLGKQHAVVRRHHETGIGVQFLREQARDAVQQFAE
ncbi:MAG: PilZ domain-containing protein [Pseudomonadota bacterium]